MSPPNSPALRSISPLHLHSGGESCPFCDQPIPHDRFDEIKQRILARQDKHSEELTARLKDQFKTDKAQALEQARREMADALKQATEDAQAKANLARAEGRKDAQAAADEQIAAAQRQSAETEAALQGKLSQAEEALRTLEQGRAARERDIRDEATRTAEASVKAQMDALETAKQEGERALRAQVQAAEAERTAAIDGSAALKTQLAQVERESAEAIAKATTDAEAREAKARREAAAAAESAAKESVAEALAAKAAAEAKTIEAEKQLRSLQQTNEQQLAERLKEQRLALEKDKTDALNAAHSAAFEDKQKLSAKIEELQRTVDKKTAEELGEGAEIDLFEALKGEFESDRIERINKGQPGADILHTVVHNGKDCGKIIYDSKNHNAWRNDFATKLGADQLNARAEHAILSTRKFPAGTRHLCMQGGIVVASPARVVAVVQLIRQHMVQSHALRLSNEARAQKTAALYSFINSERCKDLFNRIDAQAETLLTMLDREEKAHRDMWKRRGEILKSIQKVNGDIRYEIDVIIGTADAEEVTS